MVEPEFRQAGISQIFFTVSAVLFLLAWILGASGYSISIKIAAYVIFIVFCILYTISTKEIAGRFNGSKVGTIGGFFGLISGIIGLLFFAAEQFLSALTPGPHWFEWRFAFLSLHWIMETFCIGGTAALIGPFFIVYREYVVNIRLWTMSGVVFIVAGVVYSSFYPYIYVSWFFVPDSVLLAVSYGSVMFGGIAGAFAFFVVKPAGKPVSEPVEETIAN